MKFSTCSAVGHWTDVGAMGGAWDMATSSHITDGNTTNVSAAGLGAMSDENTTFVGSGTLRESSSESAGITLAADEFAELEYSIAATTEAGFGATYCFRVSATGNALPSYDVYAELTTQEKQDFVIQRGTEMV